MRILPFIFAAALGFGNFSATTQAATGSINQCSYLPQFKALTKKLPNIQFVEGLTLLDKYEADPNNENPDACEGFEIDRLRTERVTKLVYLVQGKTKLYPQAAFHCDKFDEKTARCEGPFMDGTAFPEYTGTFPVQLSDRKSLVLYSGIPTFTLVALYRAPRQKVFDIRSLPLPKKTGQGLEIEPITFDKNTVLIAMFRSSTGQTYRKLVWYFQ